MDLNQLSRSVDLIAGAVKTAPGSPAPWLEFATVTSTGAVPTVTLDSDWEQTPRPVSANAHGTLRPGRVLVMHEGPRITIMSQAVLDTGWLDLTLTGGFSSVTSYPLQWRRVGNRCEVRGMVTIPGSSQSSAFATIPEGSRPSNPSWLQGAVTSGRQVVSPALSNTSGEINLPSGYWTATPSGVVSITGSWTVDD